MTVYARIVEGIVVEIADLPADPTECFVAEIAAQFVAVPNGQSPVQGWTYAAGTFTAPAAPAAPTLAQQAAALLLAGMPITSVGTTALDGTYPCDPSTYQRVGGIVAAIAADLGLPGGGSTFNWLDTSGTPHAFSAANFSNFAKAMMDFEYQLNAIVGGAPGPLPTTPVSIP